MEKMGWKMNKKDKYVQMGKKVGILTYFPLRANSMDLRAVVLDVVVVTRKDAFCSRVSELNTRIFTQTPHKTCFQSKTQPSAYLHIY